MTLTDGEITALEGMDDHALVETWDTCKEAEDLNKQARQRVEYVLLRRMIEREADAVASGTHEIKLTHTYDTDFDKLTTLRELVEPGMIEAAYTPPEQVWTKEKWNWTVLNSWRKFGAEIADIIDRAKVFKPAQISIKRKAVKS